MNKKSLNPFPGSWAKQSIIFIMYVMCSLIILSLDFPYSKAITMGITLLLICYLLFVFAQNARKPVDGEFVFRRQARWPKWYLILLAFLSAFVSFFDGFDLFKIHFIWMILLYDICISLLTRKFHPVTLVIDGNKLRVNDLHGTTRTLSKLKKITLNGFTNTLEFLFDHGQYVLIIQTEYLEADINKLIEVCLDRSEEEVFISENLRKR